MCGQRGRRRHGGATWDDDTTSFPEVLGEVLSEGYEDAFPDELEDAAAGLLEALGPAEAFGLAKAVSQIGRTAGAIASDPAFAQVAAAALPVVGGALGTTVGGPLGTAVGARLGALAAGSLRGGPAPAAGHTPTRPGPAAQAAGGSRAAAKALVLSQHPDVLKGLLALALGEHGRTSVNGVPVAALMSMLSSVVTKAATDADELGYLGGGDGDELDDAAWVGDDEALYTAIVDADSADLADAVTWR